MRDAISRADLHTRFSAALAGHPPGRGGTFVFEIDWKETGHDGCNWYPLAAIQHWTGDLQGSLAAFRTVRERMAREYNLDEASISAAHAG